MALTQNDLKAIKEIVQGVSDTRILNSIELKQVQLIVKTEVDAKTLSDKDFEKLEELMGIVFDQKIEEKGLVTKNDTSHLPTKDEFYKKEDEIIVELKAVREEIGVLSGLHEKVNRHDRKIEKIEEKLGLQTL